jgi:tetratricopeptide (TPR) repeat protein
VTMIANQNLYYERHEGRAGIGTDMNEHEKCKMKKIDAKIDKGFKAAYSGNFDEAIRIGKDLIKDRHSSGFEILALGYQRKRNIKRAISTLVTGLKKAPDVSQMWQLLGNLYSDLHEFKKSYKAYEMGMKCPIANMNSFLLNYAIALGRDGKQAQAWIKLNQIRKSQDDASFKVAYCSTKCQMLNEQEKFPETIDEYRKIKNIIRMALAKSEDLRNQKVFNKFVSNIYCEYAFALWKMDKGKTEIRKAIDNAIFYNKHNPTTMWLVRKIRNLLSNNSHFYQIMINGEWPFHQMEDGEEVNFFTTYGVIAENEIEAIEFIKQFESKNIGEKMRIEESRKKKRMPHLPKGVYSTTGYAFYNRDEDEGGR